VRSGRCPPPPQWRRWRGVGIGGGAALAGWLKAATSASIWAIGSACAAACASLAALAVLSLLSLPSLLLWASAVLAVLLAGAAGALLLSLLASFAGGAGIAVLAVLAVLPVWLALPPSLRLAAGRSAALGATLTTGLLFWR
jgi:hypothetical protein